LAARGEGAADVNAGGGIVRQRISASICAERGARGRSMPKAARLAGIDRNYLYRMMKKHGIARKE
jgi:transcriptional regulator of acetoin/glycerol metabolism